MAEVRNPMGGEGSLVFEEDGTCLGVCRVPTNANVYELVLRSTATNEHSALTIRPRYARPVAQPFVIQAVRRYKFHAGRQLPPDLSMGPDNPFLFAAHGLWEVERCSEGDPVRWTHGRATIAFPWLEPAGPTDIAIVLELRGPPPVVRPRRMSVLLNDRQVMAMDAPSWDDGFVLLSGHVPRDGLRRGWNRLTVTAPAWQPSTVLPTGDRRRLGVMLKTIKWQRVTP